MLDRERDRARGEPLDLVVGHPEPDVVDRRGDVVARELLGMRLLDLASHGLAGEAELDRLLDTHQLRQPLGQRLLRGQLDEQRGRQPPGARDERVVHVELGLDALVGVDALGARHLLHLEPDRVAVLEHERHDGPHRHPAPAFELLHPHPELLALPLVRAQVGDVVERQLTSGRSANRASSRAAHQPSSGMP